jgi:hypothetical protein
MSGLAGVPDAAWGLAGRASRAFPNSASAPQGSPCEFALCCYFFAKSARASVYGQRRESRFGRVFRGWARFGGGLRLEGREAWCGGREVRARGAVLGGRARSRFGARASPRATARPSRRLGFRQVGLEKASKKTNARIGTRGLAARFANARGLARAGFVARTIARSPRRYARVLRFVRCRAA